MSTVPLVAVLFDPATGQRVEHREDLDEKYADSQEFMWTEGNFGCDCNRRLFMARALGEPEPADETFTDEDGNQISGNKCGSTIVLEKLTVNSEVVVEAAKG